MLICDTIAQMPNSANVFAINAITRLLGHRCNLASDTEKKNDF